MTLYKRGFSRLVP